MPSVRTSDEKLLEKLSRLALCNPFSPERIKLEKQVLGKEFEPEDVVAWSRTLDVSVDRERPNVTRLTDIAIDLIKRIKQQAGDGRTVSPDAIEHYWNVATYALLYRHIVHQDPAVLQQPANTAKTWKAFHSDYRVLVNMPGLTDDSIQTADHLFAFLCQIHRAFYNIYTFILGDSLPSIELRGAVWDSIFTCDIRRYRVSLFDRMSGLPSLVTGPSGTGKELVARAIGLSQYIPFDQKQSKFADSGDELFYPLNLSAMSANLIESELFGHRKGAYTGAVVDRKGWLELCPPHGAIFLDEIGELDPALQVKLLRVVQQRTFSRLGETKERQFSGKLIGATNRDLSHEMKAGRFREDLYYRLCADRIQTPGLRVQLDHRPEDLYSLCRHIARKVAGTGAESLAEQAYSWILKNLGADYPWRGNIRELEQCISSIMIRNQYLPPEHLSNAASATSNNWLDDAVNASLTADQLLQRYCTWLYHKTGSYESAAKKLGIDRRTVKAKIDPAMLESLGNE
jgi:transcriptional regulator with AAA-type ATPase domain